MKIVLSRKGFDSSYGGVPSPILPDGSLVSLPIPLSGSCITYDELHINGESLGEIVDTLTGGKVRGGCEAHLDPDLVRSIYPHQPGWRSLFGQDLAAQAHLRNNGVGAGDLFLFFGWFRKTTKEAGKYHFVQGAPDLHVIFGWLQIDEILSLNENAPTIPDWARYHPHLHGSLRSNKNNTIYVAREYLELEGLEKPMRGAGAFDRYREDLCLTAPRHTRAIWQLPRWFYPGDARTPLTYHRDMKRWSLEGDSAILRSVSRGQEFILDTNEYPEAISWACSMIAGTA